MRLSRKLTMSDPDMGNWDYAYNSFGELRVQEDANANVTEFAYDRIGRVVTRTENTSDVTTFEFDTATNGIGRLAEAEGPEGDVQTYTYESMAGRLATTTTVLPGGVGSFVTAQAYDPEGRVELITYPASTAYSGGLQVRNYFNAHGYLEEVRNDDSGNQLYWRMDAQTTTSTEFTLGNLVSTEHVYDEITGQLESIQASSYGETNDVQNLSFAFDTLGNLTERLDEKHNVKELIDASTGYDALNRIKEVKRQIYSGSSWGSPATTLALTYDALGNILTKTGPGSYTYGTPAGSCYGGPHAATTIGGEDFCYDANGNQTAGYDFTSQETLTTTWTAFNKPAQITDGSDTIEFAYGADRARFRQDNGFSGVTTLYIDGLFEREILSGVVTDSHYIVAGGEAVAIYKSHDDTTEETVYLHRDHLGSVVEITDESGDVVDSYAYDAFGKRREASDWDDASGAIVPSDTARGYTGHEHLDDVGIVHMNGRVYDPDTGRMLSADPYVQFPGHSQSYNRYSYVLNNPLRYTDPSGFLLAPVFGHIYSAPYGLIPGMSANPWGRVICAATTPYCGGSPYDLLSYTQEREWNGEWYGEWYDLLPPKFFLDQLDHSWGVIGWSVNTSFGNVQNNLLAVAAEWAERLEEGAPNNGSRATGHGGIAENPQVAQQGPASSQPGNANIVPNGGANSPASGHAQGSGSLAQSRGQPNADEDWQIPTPEWAQDPDMQREFYRIWASSKGGGPNPVRAEYGGYVAERWLTGNLIFIERPHGANNAANMSLSPRPNRLLCLCTPLGTVHTHPFTEAEGYTPYDPSRADINTSRDFRLPGIIITHPRSPDDGLFTIVPYSGF